MPKLYYQGHGSFRLTSDRGLVLYVDPFAGEGYNKDADIVLITHQHGDHNQLGLVARKPKCKVITEADAQVHGVYKTFRVQDIWIRAVPATNANHDPRECVGYIITLDGVKVYAAGDTSETDIMGEMPQMKLDYALLPVDGVYNMDVVEASVCAAKIGAKRTVPIHTKPGELFDETVARRFDVPGRLIVRPGEEIELTSA